MYKILGQVLYREGLRSEQQKLVNESQKEKKINHPQTHDTVKSALDVVKAVSVDWPIIKVTRLINEFNKVNNCRRKMDEKYRFLYLVSVDLLWNIWSSQNIPLNRNLDRF